MPREFENFHMKSFIKEPTLWIIKEKTVIRKIDLSNSILVTELLNIQTASYKAEAEIIDFYEIPPLMDTVETLRQCHETFYGYYLNNELCGAISFKLETDVIDIHRLMVTPKHFRKGIAKTLLNYIENLELKAHKIIVSTASMNTPAVNFYEQHGFTKKKEFHAAEGLSLSLFEKRI